MHGRRVLYVILASMMALASFNAIPAAAKRGYRQVVDITFPTRPGHYRNDYHAARSGGHVHRAIDIFNRFGTPVFAARAGRIVWLPDYEHATAGYAIQVAGNDGRLYAYYHLGRSGGSSGTAYVRGLAVGSSVRRGQRIGAMGNSGNARGGAAHLHFEIHDPRVSDPYGTTRINPYRSLRIAQRQGDYARGGGRASRSRRNSDDGVLRRGDRGAGVRVWQRQLNKVGIRTAVDGIFGSKTARSTRRFQRSRRLVVDAVVGPATRRAMRTALRNQARRDQRRRAARQAVGVLERGDRGKAVAAWQRALNRAGIPTAVDGIFGQATERSTKRFQRRRGLAVDGIVGPQTRGAMERVSSRPSRSAPPRRTSAAAPVLRRGDRSQAVARWQRRLRRVGYRIAVDGIFGPQTHRATTQFQRRNGAAVDGVVGPQTRRAMQRRLS